MIKMRSGFTIVELLIVIVVIAILAAISIVAYNGIQQRARNTQVATGATQYLKAVESYKAVHGIYPNQSGCLGASYPNGVCWLTQGATNYAVNSALDTQLSEFMPTKPTLATQLMDLGLVSTNHYQRAGLVYIHFSPTNIHMRYYLEGLNNLCVGGFNPTNEGNVTHCSKNLSI